jgi:hypothetical protein
MTTSGIRAKPRAAVERIVAPLTPGGMLLATVPLGYNAGLDDDLLEGRLGFDEVHYLKRVSASNQWAEVGSAQVEGIAYGFPFPRANGLAIASRRAAPL